MPRDSCQLCREVTHCPATSVMSQDIGIVSNLRSGEALNAIRDKGPRIISEREIDVDGHSGVFVHLEVGGKEVIRLQWVAAGSRLYTVSATSRKGSPKELEGENDFERVALGFISSFHVLP